MHRASPDQDLIDLSKEKWRWMSERNIEALEALFHEKAVFVHMGTTLSKKEELRQAKAEHVKA